MLLASNGARREPNCRVVAASYFLRRAVPVQTSSMPQRMHVEIINLHAKLRYPYVARRSNMPLMLARPCLTS